MREITFRGKTINLADNKWVYGSLIEFNERTFLSDNNIAHKVPSVMWNLHTFEGFCEVIPSTVGQYTGLTDDNKTKIFDGDILRLADSYNEIMAVIEFGNPNGFYSWGWQLRQIKGTTVNLDILLWIETECDAVSCEVIGNIHGEVTE